MYVMYYASMLRCWQLVWILVRTNHPCLRVGCHTNPNVQGWHFARESVRNNCSFGSSGLNLACELYYWWCKEETSGKAPWRSTSHSLTFAIIATIDTSVCFAGMSSFTVRPNFSQLHDHLRTSGAHSAGSDCVVPNEVVVQSKVRHAISGAEPIEDPEAAEEHRPLEVPRGSS
jgi:hypothetical protein